MGDPCFAHARALGIALEKSRFTGEGVRRSATYVPDLRFGGRLFATTARIPALVPFFPITKDRHTTHHHTPSPSLHSQWQSPRQRSCTKTRVKGWYHGIWRNSNLPDTRAHTSQPRRKKRCLFDGQIVKRNLDLCVESTLSPDMDPIFGSGPF